MTKKIINDPRSVVDETLEGFLAAHGEHYEKLPGCQRNLHEAEKG